ncbi:related to mitochondrial inheritance component mdm12 [Melanopsichium pennsylvanicum]|uniref:Mitochondrial distribution and morphology protein 12 n=1 Tax=Melanopsichium pennsylvanicum TaxID=63383 RepID=A0AAJ4XLM9_9BASI|nr:related to mitochondrial inheritance component mdm12 [Melanopsichium pennsylvanicum]
MSLDLEWNLLDDELSVRFLETINRALEAASSKRPSFIGEIHFTDLHFGSDAPDVAIRSINDIWPDFVSHDDPPLRNRRTRQATPASNATTLVESPTETFSPQVGEGAIPIRTYTQFDDATPLHRIHGPGSVASTSLACSVPVTPAAGSGGFLGNSVYQQWSTALASRGIRSAGLGGLSQNQVTSPVTDSVPPSPGYFQYWQQTTQPGFGPVYMSGNNSRQTSFDAASSVRGGMGGPGPMSSVSQIGAKRDVNSLHPPQMYGGANDGGGGGGGARPSTRSIPASTRFVSTSGQLSPNEERDATNGPVSTRSQLPSLQMQLSLVWPTTTFRLTICTSLLINYPSAAFMSLPLKLSVTGFVMRAGLIVALEGEHQRAHVCLVEEEQGEEGEEDFNGTMGKRNISPGFNILPTVTFETEVGEHEKHVLKNVGKVEKFIAEVMRKGLEDELVYPNYYTIDLPSR